MPSLTIAQVEAAVLDRLRAQITGVQIDAYPDKPESYQLKHPAGALLVRYTGSRFDVPEVTDVMVQTQTITMEIVTLVRNLHKLGEHTGLLDLLNAVRMALTGWRIEGMSKCRPTKEDFESYADGIWQYTAAFEMDVIHTEPQHTRPTIEFTEGVGYADDQPAF